jgi:hypothetical protein
MRKSSLFISAVLTTFALVMMYNVVSAYRSDKSVDVNAGNVVEVAAEAAATDTPVPTDVPTPTQAIITPEEAAQVASQVLGSDKLLSAESSNFNGVDAYLITFTNKDVAYIGLDGQVLSVQVAPVVYSVAAPVKKKSKNNNNKSSNNQSSSSSSGGEHEDHDD